MAKKSGDVARRSLAETVREHLDNRQARNPPWWERVAPEHVAELEAFRQAWRAGEYGTAMRPVAIQVAAWLKESGISQVGEQGVTTWLKRP